jgi:hypothetical protein
VSKYGPERGCGPLCSAHKPLADALGHDRVGHRSLMALRRAGRETTVTEMKEIEAHDLPGVGQMSVDRIMAAGAVLRKEKPGV